MPSKTELSFFARVYQVTQLIPYGRVTSYGAIAGYLGSARSARMVGWALNKCDTTVPAHRVVNAKGILTGKINFEGINLMQQLLDSEGGKIENNEIINIETVFLNPSKEL
jgi:methylated-DNA-protein-cysteine methyltransferase-like protein